MYTATTQEQWNQLMRILTANGTTAIIRRPGREMSHRISSQTFSLPDFPFYEFENDQLVLSLDGTLASRVGVADISFRQWDLQFVQGMTARELDALKALLTGEGVHEVGRSVGSGWEWFSVQEFPYLQYDRKKLQDLAFSAIGNATHCHTFLLQRVVYDSGHSAGTSNEISVPSDWDFAIDVSSEFSLQIPDDAFDAKYRMERLRLLLQLIPPPINPKASSD